jgi:hypothetical protein
VFKKTLIANLGVIVSEAKQSSHASELDCFVAALLAMTGE